MAGEDMKMEQQLRASLAPRDPGPDFADAVMAKLEARASQPVQQQQARAARRWQLPVALAASVFAAAFGLHLYDVHQREVRAGEQLAMALAITGNELNRIQRKLVLPEPTGFQENGS